MKFAILFITLASAATLCASIVVTVPGKAVSSTALEVVVAEDQKALNQIALQFNGARPGVFPALVDKNTGLWVAITGTVAEAQAELDVKLNEVKPQAQKQYENAFFDLIDELLVLVDDPQDPTPKLGFPELQALIAQVQSVDPMAAVNLSLNLLTIDAALKRYDTMWWDNAVRHEITLE